MADLQVSSAVGVTVEGDRSEVGDIYYTRRKAKGRLSTAWWSARASNSDGKSSKRKIANECKLEYRRKK